MPRQPSRDKTARHHHQTMKRPTLRTPNDIEVLIHCHCCPDPHPRIDAPAVKEALRHLAEWKAIVPSDQGWKTTALGAAWLCALSRVPIPTTRSFFVDADGELLEDV
jgi:hypothetical protein